MQVRQKEDERKEHISINHFIIGNGFHHDHIKKGQPHKPKQRIQQGIGEVGHVQHIREHEIKGIHKHRPLPVEQPFFKGIQCVSLWDAPIANRVAFDKETVIYSQQQMKVKELLQHIVIPYGQLAAE